MRLLSLATIALLFGAASLQQVHAQCEPDTANCKDTGDPGQICPQELPDAFLNQSYDEVITVLPPDTASLGDIVIAIEYIVVDSVKNLPPGMEYITTADKYYPDSAYCIEITGTPTEAGEFPLKIYVSVYIKYLNTIINGGQVEDDSSVVITVHEGTGIEPEKRVAFSMLPAAPNPFMEATRLGFSSTLAEHPTLQVFSILGELVHEEAMATPPGRHYFSFDGRQLKPGSYFYRVSTTSGMYSGKLLKTR